MNSDFPDIPDFLRAEISAHAILTPEQETRVQAFLKAARAPRRKTKKQAFELPQNMEPESMALYRQIQKQKAEKQALRFKMLRERRK